MENTTDIIENILKELTEQDRNLVLCFSKRLRYLEEQYGNETR